MTYLDSFCRLTKIVFCFLRLLILLGLIGDTGYFTMNIEPEGYIYCFSNPSMPGILKIGMTEREPELRLNEANSPDTWRPPTPYRIEFVKRVSNPRLKEGVLHGLLARYAERINPRREFFRVELDTVRPFFDLMDERTWDARTVTEPVSDIEEDFNDVEQTDYIDNPTDIIDLVGQQSNITQPINVISNTHGNAYTRANNKIPEFIEYLKTTHAQELIDSGNILSIQCILLYREYCSYLINVCNMDTISLTAFGLALKNYNFVRKVRTATGVFIIIRYP